MNTTDFESIHNHYERQVFDEVVRVARERGHVEPRLLADIACVALNHLPPRYIRHDVDFAFYLTAAERADNARMVAAAVDSACHFVTTRNALRLRAA